VVEGMVSQNSFHFCFYFVAKEVKDFLVYLLDISSSFENYLLNLFVCIVLLVFNILDINPLPHEQLAKIFSPSVGCLLILVIVSFAVWMFFNLMQYHLSILTYLLSNFSPT
jgi:hypothetical protein